MFKKLMGIVVILFVLTPQYLTAQDKDDDWDRDSHKRKSYHNWKWDWDWNDQERPTIELNYGIGKLKHKDFGADYSDVGLAEIKLGFSSLDEYYDYIWEYNEHFFFASNIATDLEQENDDPLLIDSDLWKFGFGWRDGYGYKMGPIVFVPYTQHSLTWSRLKMKEYPDSNFVTDINILDRYNDAFRFGTSSEAGLKLEFDSFLSLNAALETNVIFPRHLFWKHAGSVALEVIGYSTIDYFVDEILDSSPAAGPILNFLLKTAYINAFYNLKKDKMNWPFDTEAPLTYESFKLGVSFIF